MADATSAPTGGTAPVTAPATSPTTTASPTGSTVYVSAPAAIAVAMVAGLLGAGIGFAISQAQQPKKMTIRTRRAKLKPAVKEEEESE